MDLDGLTNYAQVLILRHRKEKKNVRNSRELWEGGRGGDIIVQLVKACVYEETLDKEVIARLTQVRV